MDIPRLIPVTAVRQSGPRFHVFAPADRREAPSLRERQRELRRARRVRGRVRPRRAALKPYRKFSHGGTRQGLDRDLDRCAIPLDA